MTTRSSTNGERTSRRIAAAYRKKGYEVVLPAGQGNLPEFLRGCRPDLIAQRDDDRVVVEIKPAGSLKGANDLVEMAERVARQPGWRLELVTFRDRNPDGDTASSEWLEAILARIEAALDWRNEVMHGRSADPPPSAEQAAELERLCRDVLAQANQGAAT